MCKSAVQNLAVSPSESRIQERNHLTNMSIFSPYSGVQEYVKEEQLMFAVLTSALGISFNCLNMLCDVIHPKYHVLLWICH